VDVYTCCYISSSLWPHLLFRVTNSTLSKLSLMKMKLLLRTERLWHKIINATRGYNPVTKHGTVTYGHNNKLSCAMEQVAAASLSLFTHSSPVQSMWEWSQQSANKRGFTLSTTFSPCQYHSTNTPHSLLHLSITLYTAWFKNTDSISYVYISWTIYGMWMIYITYSNTTPRALANAQLSSSVSSEQNGYYSAQDFLR